MKNCPNCNSEKLNIVFSKDDVITYQNVPMSTYDAAIGIPRGKMNLIYCNECTLLFNASFDDSKVGYGDEYENDQSHSAIFKEHIDAMASKILFQHAITSHKILEIGCGNGYFLRKLINAENKNIGIGYDKSLKNDILDERMSLYKKYYDESDHGGFELVMSRHVVEHILNNNPIISLLRSKNPEALYLIETPSLEWIIDNNTFFDIFYEHCSYFSEFSLAKLMMQHGLKVSALNKVFNDQYLLIEASSSSKDDFEYQAYLSLDKVQGFFSNFSQMINYYKSLIDEYIGKGKIAIWGAGAKGVTFANLIDPARETVDCVIDINPNKIGKFIPGTGHMITPKDVLKQEKFGLIIIMNSNYKAEITAEIDDDNIAIYSL